MNINQLLDRIDNLETVPDTREYWLVRTQSGKLYDNFIEHGFVAIDHERLTLKMLYDLKKSHPNEKEFKDKIKSQLEFLYKGEDINPALAASQIIKFVYHLKKNDIVIIPSEGSNRISFGIIKDTAIPEMSQQDLKRTGCEYKKRKTIEWIKTTKKNQLDPYLYKMLVSHQAITNANNYSQEIERNLSNFFIKNSEGNLVLSVQKSSDIGAFSLFQTGYYLLNQLSSFAKENNIQIDLDSIDIKTYLNSPGKIHLKAPKPSTVFLVAVLFVCIIGGGLKIERFGLDLNTDGLIKKVIDFQNNSHDRKVKDALLQNIKDLKIETPDDIIKIFQQLSDNKDLPK